MVYKTAVRFGEIDSLDVILHCQLDNHIVASAPLGTQHAVRHAKKGRVLENSLIGKAVQGISVVIFVQLNVCNVMGRVSQIR